MEKILKEVKAYLAEIYEYGKEKDWLEKNSMDYVKIYLNYCVELCIKIVYIYIYIYIYDIDLEWNIEC
jgi:hypothetical protein